MLLRGRLGILALAAFTVFITWRAKKLETSLSGDSEIAGMVNKQAPAFSLPSLSGKEVSLSDFHGGKVVVSFWASWCGPCQMEMPDLRSFYERYHNDNTKFQILAVSLDDNRVDPTKFARDEKLPFPVLIDLTQQTQRAYSADAIPTIYVINEEGKIVYGHVGYDPMLDFQLAQALGIKLSPTSAGAVNGNASN